jgi:hypothetical protein
LSDRILIAENGCAALFVSTVSPDSETAALQCGRRVSIVTDASVRVERVGRQHWQGSLSDRILIAENRCAALFVSTVSSGTHQLQRRVPRRR